MNRIEELLVRLNPEYIELANYISREITRLNKLLPESQEELYTEKDTVLITYADQFQAEGESNLVTLNKFLENDLEGKVSVVHLLPFYPWTSDDGFSPIDYKEVCPEYGDWKDIEEIKPKKMFDCVFNHISSENSFFKSALSGDKECEKMFHIVDEGEYSSQAFQDNIKKIVRPRTSPLFTKYDFNGESKYVWTTFSADQVDLNLNDKKMFKYLLETFFLYIEKGSKFFRIDAVPFMWKEFGTNCSHLENTHNFVKLFRAIVDRLNSNLYIVTESNVPHLENISYWGTHEDEAHIIYNFSLAPLVLHAVVNGDCKYINSWASEVFNLKSKNTFLNFTATHDGIGMRGLEGIVPDADVEHLCQLTEAKGGNVGKKTSRDGTTRPYELNITWASIMEDSALDKQSYINKVVNSHAIVMFFPGIGAHYAHNFFGSKNWSQGARDSGIPRRTNRKKLAYPIELNEESTEIKKGLLKLIEYKGSKSVFSPKADFEIQGVHENCLCFDRYNESERIRVYFNLSSKVIEVDEVSLAPYALDFKSI